MCTHLVDGVEEGQEVVEAGVGVERATLEGVYTRLVDVKQTHDVDVCGGVALHVLGVVLTNEWTLGARPLDLTVGHPGHLEVGVNLEQVCVIVTPHL